MGTDGRNMMSIPAYYIYQLYRMFGNELVYSSSDDPDVSIYAARRADGALTIMVVNLSLKRRQKPFGSRIRPKSRRRRGCSMLDHKAENVGELEISNGISVPPQSMTLFVIPQGQ